MSNEPDPSRSGWHTSRLAARTARTWHYRKPVAVDLVLELSEFSRILAITRTKRLQVKSVVDGARE
jgi:hypothetical protein